MKRLLILGTLLCAAMNAQILIPIMAAGGSASVGGGYYRTFLIDHTKVPNTDQTNFPVVFYGTYTFLKDTGSGGRVLTGTDVRLYTNNDCSTGLMDFVIKKRVGSTGLSEIWGRVPTASHTVDTPVYVCMGNTTYTTDVSNPTGVWNSNFKAVWQFGDGTTLSLADSTSNGRTLTNVGGCAATSSVIDGGVNCSTGSKYFTASDTGLPSGGGARTFEGWFTILFHGTGSVIMSYGTSGTGSGFQSVNFADTTLTWRGWSNDKSFTIPAVSDGGTYHVAIAYGSGSANVYINGSAIGAQSVTWNTVLNGTFYLFADPVLLGAAAGVRDQFTISDVVRSADWIAATYNNQSSPSTFYSVGSEVAL